MDQGDRVRLLTEAATFGTVLAVGVSPHTVAVKFDDGRAMTVERDTVATLR
ncbi:hypothetical protein [Tsukamurella soli]|uniref:DUF1918 domain-containing protein n=1 Tax=Tsukamurella soli TaxID=644556 RepID=A0ABP8IZY1_9ACTN